MLQCEFQQLILLFDLVVCVACYRLSCAAMFWSFVNDLKRLETIMKLDIMHSCIMLI